MQNTFMPIQNLFPINWIREPNQQINMNNDMADAGCKNLNKLYGVDVMFIYIINHPLFINCHKNEHVNQYHLYIVEMLEYYQDYNKSEIYDKWYEPQETNCLVLVTKITSFYCLILLQRSLAEMKTTCHEWLLDSMALMCNYLSELTNSEPRMKTSMKHLQSSYLLKGVRVNFTQKPNTISEAIAQITHSSCVVMIHYLEMLDNEYDATKLFICTMAIKSQMIDWSCVFDMNVFGASVAKQENNIFLVMKGLIDNCVVPTDVPLVHSANIQWIISTQNEKISRNTIKKGSPEARAIIIETRNFTDWCIFIANEKIQSMGLRPIF